MERKENNILLHKMFHIEGGDFTNAGVDFGPGQEDFKGGWISE